MKKNNYLIAAIILTVVIIIILFQNLGAKASYSILFNSMNLSVAFLILVITVFGMAAGALYTIFIQSAFQEKIEEQKEEEETGF
jgi:uncharacterized membrane protein YdfJ with MMPL/SSD domain